MARTQKTELSGSGGGPIVHPLGAGNSKKKTQLPALASKPPKALAKLEQKRTSKMAVKDVDAEPPARRQLLFDQAHKLATMPRSRIHEFTQAAFWSAIATATSGIAGICDIVLDHPTQPKILDIGEMLIFAICMALALFGAFFQRAPQTSTEYLNELYKLDINKPTRWQRFIKWAFPRPSQTL